MPARFNDDRPGNTTEEDLVLSEAALRALRAELEHLKHEVKPGLVERIAAARADGDLSENAEYHAAREELGKLEGRIQAIEDRLRRARRANVLDDGSVQPGKVVVIELEGGAVRRFLFGAREEKTRLARNESDAKLEFASVNSPLGRACLGRKVGEVVVYEAPAGQRTAKILSVDLVDGGTDCSPLTDDG